MSCFLLFTSYFKAVFTLLVAHCWHIYINIKSCNLNGIILLLQMFLGLPGHSITVQGVAASLMVAPLMSVAHWAPDGCGAGFVHVRAIVVSPAPHVVVQPVTDQSLQCPGISAG